MEIVDSHVHYWTPPSADAPWDPKGIDIGPTWSVEALLTEMRAAGIERIINVTPTVMGYDNRYTIEGAERFPDRIPAVIGRFDIGAPNVRERLVEFAKQPLMAGIRITAMQPLHWEWYDDGTVDRFLSGLEGLPLVAQLYAPGRPEKIAAAAEKHPDVRIFVDHMGVQHRDASPFQVWDGVLALAKYPNVFIKASAFPECAHEPYPFPNVHKYVKDLYQTFGPGRLIWGSNFPPSGSACTVPQNVAFFRDLPFIPDTDKQKIFAGTLLGVLAQLKAERTKG